MLSELCPHSKASMKLPDGQNGTWGGRLENL